MAFFDPLESSLSLVGITTDDAGVLGGVWLDAVVHEVHTMGNRVTRHPLESGADVVDHIISEPDSVEIECRVTNSPLRPPQSHADNAREVQRQIDVPPADLISLGPLGPVDTSVGIGFFNARLPLSPRSAVVRMVEGAAGRVDAVYDELRRMMSERRLVDIRTSLRDYIGMAIEQISIPVDRRGVLEFTVTASSITVAQSKLVDAPTPTQQRARPTENAGRQPVSVSEDLGAEEVSLTHQALF